jgi:hypothetical protein
MNSARYQRQPPIYHSDDDKIMAWFFGFLGVMFLLFVGLVILDRIYTTYGQPYEVPGVVVNYDEGPSGRTIRTFVYLQQHDGITRRYNTYVNASECHRAPIGTSIPVVVKPSYNELWDSHHFSSDMKYNPCR